MLKNINITAVGAILWAFCFVSAYASDNTLALRGRRELKDNLVTLYRCDAENRTITSTISNSTEELEGNGFDIRICFRATRRAINDGMYIGKIDDFTFTKERTNGDLAAAGPTRQIPVIMRQNAVDSGIVKSDDFSKIECDPGSEVCAIETRLTGYFFLTSGTIYGKGTVMMQRGTFDQRRELQDMLEFEEVSLDIRFTGGGRAPMEPQQRNIIIISIIIALLVLCCMCGVIWCCMAGICCFAGRDRDEEEEENVEEVSVKIEWDPEAKKSKKTEEEDMSETESLEDDKYWDNEADHSEDESDDINTMDDYDTEMGGLPYVPASERTNQSSKKSKSRNSRYQFVQEDDWNEPADDPDDTNEPVLESVKSIDSTEKSQTSRSSIEEARQKKRMLEEKRASITSEYQDVEESPRKRKSEKKKRTSVTSKYEDVEESPRKRKSEKKKKRKSERKSTRKSQVVE